MSCFLDSRRDDLALFDRENCLSWSEQKPNYLLVGDSMAHDLVAGLQASLPEVHLLQALSSGCRPAIGAEGFHRCTALMNSIFKDYLPAHHLKGVILSALWSERDHGPLLKTVAALKSYVDEVIVFGPRVLYQSPLPRLMAMSLIKGDPELVARSRDGTNKHWMKPLPRGWATPVPDTYLSIRRCVQTVGVLFPTTPVCRCNSTMAI